MKKIFLFSMLFFVQYIHAQSTVIRSIETNNSTSVAKIDIHQDPRIENRVNAYINRIDPTMPYTGPGFRVQVFSSNNFKTAKADAYSIEKQIKNTFPEQQVYVTYSSPFWKVRVGNFRTNDEAQKLRSEILKVFPGLGRNAYAVRENRVRRE